MKKKLLYLVLTFSGLLALHACLLIDWAASSTSEPETCTFKVDNNSSDRVYVGGLMISDSLLIHEQFLGFLGYVDAHRLSDDMRLPIVPYNEESELTLDLFFKTYHLDTLVVGLASDLELISQWISNHERSKDYICLTVRLLNNQNVENIVAQFAIFAKPRMCMCIFPSSLSPHSVTCSGGHSSLKFPHAIQEYNRLPKMPWCEYGLFVMSGGRVKQC